MSGYNEAEGLAASLRQQADWIEESREGRVPLHDRIDLGDIDTDELRAAADFIERGGDAKTPGLTADNIATLIHKFVRADQDVNFIDRLWLTGVREAAEAIAALAPGNAGEAKPVAYRWRQPGNKHWIYDPTPEWIEDHKHEIELEPLYAAPASNPQEGGAVSRRASEGDSK